MAGKPTPDEPAWERIRLDYESNESMDSRALVRLYGRPRDSEGYGPGVGCVPCHGALRSVGHRGDGQGFVGARMCFSALVLVSVCMRFSFTLCGVNGLCRVFACFRHLALFLCTCA
jgi:hypothetical protein